jgi:hypothetical protein
MPDWTSNVPDQPRGHALPIRRTPASKPLEAIITSPDLIGTYTHFYKGSTTPCGGPECDACQNGTPYRWHAYMTACDVFTNLHFIFEVTALAAEFLTAYRDHHGSLRGCHFKSKRWNNRPNGRILIQTKPADLGERQLPQPPDLKKCMAILWSLPEADVQDGAMNPENRTQSVTATPKRTNGQCPS